MFSVCLQPQHTASVPTLLLLLPPATSPPPPTHTPDTRLLHNSTLAKIQPRSVSYPEQSQAIREALARVLEGEEEWTKAAQVLQGIDLDSGGWSHTDCI